MSSTSSKSNKTKAGALALVQALIAGTQKHLSGGSFTLGGVTYTAASIIPVLQGLGDAITAVNVAQSSARDAVAAKQGIEVKVDPIMGDYQRFIRVTFSNATQTLADFGLTPPKARTPMTAAQLAARAAKAEATRLARGTTSKKKKLAVKGNVTGVTVTPITASTSASPAAPVSPVTPASPYAQPASAASSAPAAGTATK